MDIEELKRYYRGFYIDQPVSNNFFSFDQREIRKIYVAPLICGTVWDASIGEETAFCEVHEGREIARKGLKNFIYWNRNGKHIFIFDNHNHAFVFWVWGLSQDIFEPGSRLIHIDQHKDTRRPSAGFSDDLAAQGVGAAFEYANTVLNVGNFIAPAIERGFFSEVIQCDHLEAFASGCENSAVLDIDLDIFSRDMEYIPQSLKMDFIQARVRGAKLITIATSPYFIDEEKGVTILHQIFSSDMIWS